MRVESSAVAPRLLTPGVEKPSSMRSFTAPRSTAYLDTGHVFVPPKPDPVLTILDSCVPVCLWNARVGAGAMTQFLLPRERIPVVSKDVGGRSGRKLIFCVVERDA